MKAYIWKPHEDSDSCIAIIAENSKEAKKMGWAFWGSEYGNDDSFTDQRCTLYKDKVDIEGLPKGPVEDIIEGLRRGLYGYAEEVECPRCKRDGQDVVYDNGFFCTSCEGLEKCERCGQFSYSPEDKTCDDCDKVVS